MPKKIRKKKVVVREVPPKIKEIKPTTSADKKESLLEREVEAVPETFTLSAAALTSPILSSEEQIEATPTLPAPRIRPGQENFSQSLSYSTTRSQQAETDDERRRRYTSVEESARQINPSIRTFEPQFERIGTARNDAFVSQNDPNTTVVDFKPVREYYDTTTDDPLKPKRRRSWES